MFNEPLSKDDVRFYCGSIYHLMRLSGRGADAVLPLYELSIRVGYKSGRFFARMTEIAIYLNCGRMNLYSSADLLVGSGFWKVLTATPGKAVEYKPISHEDWVAENPARSEVECCKKLHMPWDDEEQDPLGKALYGVTGGTTFFPNVLKGWRGIGLTDDQIIDATKRFMESPAVAHTHDRENLSNRLPQTKGRAFRRQLGDFLRKEFRDHD